jgi:PKD repeat protein
MPLYKNVLLSGLLGCLPFAIYAQQPDTAIAEILPVVSDNSVKLGSSLRQLRQVAGAPEAYYSYFWEMGDGTYSFEKEPLHIYKDTGTYNIRLFATNNYDDGKKPNTKPRPVKVKSRTALAVNTMPAFFTGESSLELKTNTMPRPGEDMVLLVGYRNGQKSKVNEMSGSLVFLYNEKQFKQNSFAVDDIRSYHSERKIGLDSLLAYAPASEEWLEETEQSQGLFTAGYTYERPAAPLQMMQVLKQEMNAYHNNNMLRVEKVKKGEERFLFISLNTLPEMIKDTNAVVTIGGLFIPDDPSLEMERFNLELQIVASHDPNRMMLKNRRMNYRFTGRNRNIVYKVQFQNTGKGPAKKVAVTVKIPGMLNTATVELVDMKPKCTWCDSAYSGRSCIDTIVSKDSIQFIFNNIYLPGTQQDGVTDPDSTMGFIKYKLHFGKGMVKQSFQSSAAIVFDKNEPIYTNRSTGKFKKGLSPGIIAGYGIMPGTKADLGKHNLVLGATLSEFAPHKRYWQWELYVQQYSTLESGFVRRDGGDTVIANGVGFKLNYRERYNRIKVFSIDAVPVQFRYNFSSFFAAGVGALVSAEVNRTTTRIYRVEFAQPNTAGLTTAEKEEGKSSESFANWRGALFADVQLGRVRTGPAVGLRFLQYTNPMHQQLLLYASWKL